MTNTTGTGNKWEKASKVIINHLAETLKLRDVKGDPEGRKIKLEGESGTEWQADLTAYRDNEDSKLVKIECKFRSGKDAVKQAEMGGIVFSCMDTNTDGIVVVNSEPQVGAIKIAAKHQIGLLVYREGENIEDFTIRVDNWLENTVFFVGFTEVAAMHDEFHKIVTIVNPENKEKD